MKQYTDKNGKVIKEGDFVQMEDDHHGTLTGVILFDFKVNIPLAPDLWFVHPKSACPLGYYGNGYREKLSEVAEVIGNTTNNPEMERLLFT